MKRVLVLTFTFPPNRDGVSQSAYWLAQGLASRGYTVGVGTEFHPERDLAAYPPLIVNHFRISGTASLRSPIRGEVAEFVSFITDFKPDVVFCECWDLWTTVLALRAFRHSKIRLILISHGYTFHLVEWHRRFPFGLGQWFARLPAVFAMPFTMRRFDFVVFNSEQRDFGRFFDRVIADVIGYRGGVVSANAVDFAEIDGAADDFRRTQSIGAGPMFLCVANYSERKNQILALRAFRRAAIPQSTLVFIGSEFNDYSARLFQEESELRKGGSTSSEVVILEKLSRPTVLSALKACDAFVLSAHAETMPVALLEAMAAGKPFISTNTGCVKELPGGILAGNEAGFQEAMITLAQNFTRREELGRMGRAAAWESCSLQKVTDGFQRLCEDGA